MPITHFLCDVTKAPIDFSGCINCASSGRAKSMSCGHSSDVLSGIKKFLRKEQEGFSVTEIADCPRALWFKKKKDYGASPSKLYYAFRGQIAHKMMEELKQPGDISEQRLFMSFLGTKISGQPDLIRGSNVYDFKTISHVPKNPLDAHVMQLSLYAFLAGNQNPAIRISRGFIVYVSFTSHALVEIELLSEDKVRKFLEERVPHLQEIMSSGLPPDVSKYHPNWRCGTSTQDTYCDVRFLCNPPEEESKRRRVKTQGA